MRRIHQYGCTTVALLLFAGPAAAQEPRWAQDLARSIEAHVETIINEHVELRLAQNVQLVLAQASREANEAARRAAQRAREAERQRRADARRGPEYTEQISRTLKLGRNGTLDLQNVSGSIAVTGGGGNDVRIEATKRVRHPNESEGRALLQGIDVRMTERNGSVEVRTEYPRRNWSGGVDFVITMPRDGNVVLRSVSGDVRVTSLNGELRVDSISGNVVATMVRRIRQAKSISGDIEIADSEIDEVVASTTSGNIVARALKARTVDLQSITGDVRINDVESERTYIRSVSGDIGFSGRLSRNGRYEYQSHSGDVRVSLANSQGFSVEATTFNGDLRSDYPLTLQGNPPNDTPRGRGQNRAIRGVFGDGGALLTLQSFSGNITITKQ